MIGREADASCILAPKSQPLLVCARGFSRLSRELGRTAAALILLTAATLKWHELPVVNHTGEGLFHAPWFAFAQIQFEAALALWLLSGQLVAWSRRAAIVCFSTFAAVAFYEALAGQPSCGCFGALKVNPWLTLILDLAMLSILAIGTKQTSPASSLPPPLALAPSFCPRSFRRHWQRGMLAAGMAAVLSLTLWRMPAPAAGPSQAGLTFASGLAILQPEKCLGRPLPILDYLTPGSSGQAGDWKSAIVTGKRTLILYSNDCNHCRRLLPNLLKQFSPTGLVHLETSIPPYVFIEIPPYATGGDALIPPDSSVPHLRLTDQQEWFADTPVVIRLEDGIVRNVVTGRTAEKSDVFVPPPGTVAAGQVQVGN